MEPQGVPDEALQDLLSEAVLAKAHYDNSIASRAEAISHGQRLLSLIPSGPIRKRYLEPIGRVLYQQYEETGEFQMLEDALALLDEAIQEATITFSAPESHTRVDI